jgi:hypothetical protein
LVVSKQTSKNVILTPFRDEGSNQFLLDLIKNDVMKRYFLRSIAENSLFLAIASNSVPGLP